jgi:hypothetical protein
VPKVNLSGAYGVPSPPPSAAVVAHPERALRFARYLWLLWGIRLGALAALVAVLYATHVI